MKLFLIVFVIGFINISLIGQSKNILNNYDLENTENEIWSLEEDYISYFRDANHKAILSLWHNEFLGWPDSEVKPTGRERGQLFLEKKYSKPMDAVFKIIPEGIRVTDNVAINHYSLIISLTDKQGKKQQSESRITHTWIRENEQWKILGGMSSQK